MWVYQDIIAETEPDIIVECGAAQGGSAHYLADFCDALNHGHVISIDIEDRERPGHDRIKYLIGSSVEDEVVNTVYDEIDNEDDVMVILDSDHRKQHVLSELQTYSEIVSPGQYLIVEDTNLNGNPVREDFGPGPNEAIKQFLKYNDRFVIDESREKHQLTFNPGGYLKRVEWLWQTDHFDDRYVLCDCPPLERGISFLKT